jgi:hypothetical protein
LESAEGKKYECLASLLSKAQREEYHLLTDQLREFPDK